MKSKPARYGIKYWCLVDVATRFLLDVDIYLGKISPGKNKESQVGMKCDLKLMAPFYKSHRSLTVDNFLPAYHSRINYGSKELPSLEL